MVPISRLRRPLSLIRRLPLLRHPRATATAGAALLVCVVAWLAGGAARTGRSAWGWTTSAGH